MGSYAIMWEFMIEPALSDEFEQAYHPEGEWAELFRCSPDYIKTELLHDTDHPERYITIDYWRSEDAYAAFKEGYHDEYEGLDRKCEPLTLTETHLGNFQIK